MSAEPNVASLMSTEVLTVAPEMSVTEVARVMVTNGVSSVPVVVDQRLVGIVTETDIIAQQMEVDAPAYGTFLDGIFRLPWDHSNDELRRVLATTAGELMTQKLQTVSPEMPIS